MVYPRFGVPVFFSYVAAAWTYACAAAFLYCFISNCVRNRRPPPLMYVLPAVTQYVWFFVAGLQPAWVEFVPFFHGVQYLLIAWAMQIRQDADRRAVAPTRSYVAVRTMRWYAINLAIGAIPFYLAPRLVSYIVKIDLIFVTAILFTAFQVHHSFVDGIIWKLRARSVVTPLMGNVTATLRAPVAAQAEPARAAA